MDLKSIFIKGFTFSIRFLDLIFPKDRSLIVCGAPSFNGNTYYFFSQTRYNQTKDVIWLSRDKELVKTIRSEYGKHKAYHLFSLPGLYKFLRAKTAVFSHGAADFFYFIGKRNCRKFVVNLWHGIPIKSVETISDGNVGWDLMPVSSSIEQKLFSEKYGVTSDLPIIGMPRNEYLFNADYNDQIPVLRKLRPYIEEVSVMGNIEFIITYAPTYRDFSKTKIFPFEDFDAKELIQYLRKHKILIILKLHPNDFLQGDYEANRSIPLFKAGVLIVGNGSNELRMQELLMISDLLITDYSSNYFDFLLTRKPTIFIPYDQDEYEKEVGFALDYELLARRTRCLTQADFIDMLDRLLIGSDGVITDSWHRAINLRKYHEYDPTKCTEELLKLLP